MSMLCFFGIWYVGICFSAFQQMSIIEAFSSITELHREMIFTLLTIASVVVSSGYAIVESDNE
jgi:hypothetical protein